MSADAIVQVKDVGKIYDGGVEALASISLALPQGKLSTLLGPSGCGKTTLLKIIAGLIPPSRGEIWVKGTKVEGPGPERAFVFQDFALLPWANVLRNVAFGLELRGLPKPERDAIARKHIGEVGLASFESSYPHQLSGGMRQRVVIAMAVALHPTLLIMDEPTTALDVVVQQEIMAQIGDLQQELGFSILFITHDMSLMIELCDRMAVMYSGRFVETAEAKGLFANPRHPYTRALINAFPPMHGPVAELTGLGEGVRFTNIPDLVEVSPGHLAALDSAGTHDSLGGRS